MDNYKEVIEENKELIEHHQINLSSISRSESSTFNYSQNKGPKINKASLFVQIQPLPIIIEGDIFKNEIVKLFHFYTVNIRGIPISTKILVETQYENDEGKMSNRYWIFHKNSQRIKIKMYNEKKDVWGKKGGLNKWFFHWWFNNKKPFKEGLVLSSVIDQILSDRIYGKKGYHWLYMNGYQFANNVYHYLKTGQWKYQNKDYFVQELVGKID